MASRQYAYQYETSPRKIKPEYNAPKRKKVNKKSTSKTNSKRNTKKKSAKSNARVQKQIKANKKLQAKTRASVIMKCIIMFAILFFIIFRNSQISQSFSKIQSLKNEMSTIQKENDQLEINIQNSINASTIEQAAKELLGMQKLNNKQMVQISLPKKDYVEPRTEEVIIEEKESWISTLLEKIMNIF